MCCSCSRDETQRAQIGTWHLIQKISQIFVEWFRHLRVDPRFLNGTTLCSVVSSITCYPTHGLHKFMWQMSQCNWGTGVSQTSHLNTSWPLQLGSILRYPDHPRGGDSERPKKKFKFLTGHIYRYDVRIIIMLHKSIKSHFDELHLWLKTLYYDVIKLIFKKFFF